MPLLDPNRQKGRTKAMRNTYTIEERNRVVEEHLWCIDTVMEQNKAHIKAARLERDDVYQCLCIRLIRAVGSYDSEKMRLKEHIFHQLLSELKKCERPSRVTGITCAPRNFRWSDIASIDDFADAEYRRGMQMAA